MCGGGKGGRFGIGKVMHKVLEILEHVTRALAESHDIRGANPRPHNICSPLAHEPGTVLRLGIGYANRKAESLAACPGSTYKAKIAKGGNCMNELKLVKSAGFGEIQCDFYGDGKEFYVTREQIGMALEYSDPQKAIGNLHNAHKERMEKYSFLESRNGRNIYFYNRKGVMELCRWSQQPKADAFMDFCWEVMDSLMSGKSKIVGMTDYQRQTIHIQKAKLLTQIAAEYDGTYKQVLQSYATKELTGEFLLPLPALERKTYSAAEIGEQLGISAHKVGNLANAHGLKTDKYGKWFVDKSPYSSKEVQSFRYFDSVIPTLRELL